MPPPPARERAVRARRRPALRAAGRTFAYVRVSSDEQAETGQSLAVQQQLVHGWAMQHGKPLANVFVEPGISGGVPFHERPEGGKLWQTAQKGDAVVAAGAP